MGAVTAAGSGGVAINGSAAATKSAQVTITVPPPTTGASTLRLSNDNAAWLEVPWTSSVPWSLVDPAAGGADLDGPKSVWVQAGGGASQWTAVGSASIELDRIAPVIGPIYPDGRIPDGPVDNIDYSVQEGGSGLLRTEVSLDGMHFRPLAGPPQPGLYWYPGRVDVRETLIGGSWAPGERTIHVRGIDRAGNVGESSTLTVTVTRMWSGDDIPTTFSFPKPAVTGALYTIQPNFDETYRVPVGHVCDWTLVWGTETARRRDPIDETYGRVQFGVRPVNGKCAPWTFTLPHTPPREYVWSLAVGVNFDQVDYVTTGTFGAALGSTSRAITSSNLPLYYMLPSDDLIGIGESVRYRLYAVGGAAVQQGLWHCHPASDVNFQTTQQGGTVFDCPVTRSEPWLTVWWKENSEVRWLVEYDPIGDRSRPTVDTFRVTPAHSSTLGTAVTAHLSWKGHDKGSGVRSYSLQVSKNGGSWGTVALSSSMATTHLRGLVLGASYRFRVRAMDRAGNVGAWVYTETFRPTAYDETTSAATWSSGWSRSASSGAFGGSVRTSGTAGAYGNFRFTGLSVGVLAPRDPAGGYAQIYVDGALFTTVSLAAATAQAPRVIWSRSWNSRGTHTIRVRVLGTAGHPTVPIDAFVTMR